MNDSPSTTSPEWPTHWPSNSFKNIWTWLVAGFVALIFVGAATSSVYQGGVQIGALTPKALAISLAVTFALEGGLVWLVLGTLPALSKLSLRQLGFTMPSFNVVAWAVLGAIAMVVVANGSATLIENALHSKHEEDVVQIFKNLHDPASIGIFGFLAIVFAPFCEEVLFRVFFFNVGLRFGGFWAGAIVSGVLFGIAHGDLVAAVPLALGGIVLCYVYYRTRNAWASMISHALFNSLSIVALTFAPKIAS
ncbi:MAG: CPBP family intramembrane metalloprotease [Candidatus Eremiobacteraeota bacterium]|nr:CPBP family intramembrane metalloprotease [Candidatus Eremiobacteraeota bacterium]